MPTGFPGRGFRTRLPRSAIRVAIALTLVATLTSCGLLGSDDDGESPSGGNGGLEQSELKVSIMKASDVAPFHLAMQENFFSDEGLEISFVDAKSGGESTQKMLAGEVDIAYASYTPFFLAESKGAARNLGGVKLIAEGSSAGPGSTMVLALPNSSVKSIKDMPGKRVAVTATGTISDLLVNSTLKTNGVDYKSIQWVPTPFPATASALKSGTVDAAFATEPFIQDAQRNAGAVAVFDPAAGPTADLPTAGWASTGNFTKENPKTIAAFQRAMQRATDLARTDRGLVEPVLVEHSGVDEQTAKKATLLTFQSKLDATRLQRVPDLMVEFEVISAPLDVKKMIVPTAPVS